jgi:hypothetical protein
MPPLAVLKGAVIDPNILYKEEHITQENADEHLARIGGTC